MNAANVSCRLLLGGCAPLIPTLKGNKPPSCALIFSEQELNSHHRSRNDDSGDDDTCRVGREGMPETEAEQESNQTASPGSGHRQGNGDEYGKRCQTEVFMILYVLPASAGEKPSEELISNGKTPQVI